MTQKIEALKLGENLKKIKKEKGLTKSDMVRKTGLDYHTISKIEHGITPNPGVGTALKIARALGITLDELVK